MRGVRIRFWRHNGKTRALRDITDRFAGCAAGLDAGGSRRCYLNERNRWVHRLPHAGCHREKVRPQGESDGVA